jgi:23S rRNA (cytidine1920-2'-O)/16S rRNA (cytidine1409-2'-O)-methyltransferase
MTRMPADAPSPARLDRSLVERGFAASRERAQALVAAGLVEVDGVRARSAAQAVAPGQALRLTGRDHPWAGRGGLKLTAALDVLDVDPSGRVALDAGASTGGFTDVLLQRGATLVYAVDVGRGQLDPRLARDPRVVVMDDTNIRYLEPLAGQPPSLVTLDLSFISLRLVLPLVARLAARPADVVALVKPQFELGREAVGKGGIVRDAATGEAAAHDLLRWAETSLGAAGVGPVPSPVRGAKGNREWFVHLRLEEA